MDTATQSGKNRQVERRRAAQMMKRILIHFRSQMDEKLRPQGVTTAQLQLLKAIRDEPGVSGGAAGAIVLRHASVGAVVACGT